jgi:hypothetical protein
VRRGKEGISPIAAKTHAEFIGTDRLDSPPSKEVLRGLGGGGLPEEKPRPGVEDGALQAVLVADAQDGRAGDFGCCI